MKKEKSKKKAKQASIRSEIIEVEIKYILARGRCFRKKNIKNRKRWEKQGIKYLFRFFIPLKKL